jgi:uncharacterized protein YjbI with pentapeptide repeats
MTPNRLSAARTPLYWGFDPLRAVYRMREEAIDGRNAMADDSETREQEALHSASGWRLVDFARLKNPPVLLAGLVYTAAALVAFTGLLIGLGAFFLFGYEMFAGKPEHRIEAAKVFFPVLVALIGGPVLIWRALTAHWAAQAARHQAEVAREAHYTTLFTKAVEQLGATREVKETIEIADGSGGKKRETITKTEPNLEVRLGAIYALERIAHDSERDHWPIMKVLCAYIRNPQNSPVAGEQHPGEDVQAAVEVIGRRPHKMVPTVGLLDFQGADLRKVVLSYKNFEGGNFDEADLTNAQFNGAELNDASFVNSRLTEASFFRAGLQRAAFFRAELRHASFVQADLRNASFGGAHVSHCKFDGANLANVSFADARSTFSIFSGLEMSGASFAGAQLPVVWFSDCRLAKALFSRAHLESGTFANADLREANFGEAHLKEVSFKGANLADAWLAKADLRGANFEASILGGAHFADADLEHATFVAADLSEVSGLQTSQLNKAIADEFTITPEWMARPATWPSTANGVAASNTDLV